MFKFILIFALVILFSQILVRFVKSIRASVSNISGGKAVHVETPIAVFDVKPQDKPDPALATILVYPGATRAESQPPEYEADIQVLGREYRIVVATYWTLTPADVVWEFYKRELQGWQEKRQRGQGRSLSQKGADGVRTVRVYTQNGGTLIETKLSSNMKASAAAAGGPSDARFGILR
jgi:hypothetical protein